MNRIGCGSALGVENGVVWDFSRHPVSYRYVTAQGWRKYVLQVIFFVFQLIRESDLIQSLLICLSGNLWASCKC